MGWNESCMFEPECYMGPTIREHANAFHFKKGGEKYQAAFYVFEELASVPSTTSASSLVSQAISELHLDRLPEAEVALKTALEKYPDYAEAIANSIVLNALSGKDTAELKS